MENVKTIIICKGIQASGKTTWSLEQLLKYPDKYKRVNRDSLRAMLDGDRYSWDHEKFIVSIRNHILERSLRKNYDVILDDTNLHHKNFDDVCSIAQKVGNVRVMEKYFEVTLKEALQRNAKRPKPVPDHVIENFFDKYISNKKIEVRDIYFPKTPPVYAIEDPNKISAIIVDVDGTAAINTKRDYYDMTRVLEDIPHEPVCKLVKMLSQYFAVVFVSGRDDVCKEDTELWFTNHGIPFNDIFMRKTGDTRPDFVVKEEIYHQQIKPKYCIRYVFDDRTSVVDMWRKNQLCCLQVASGDF